MSGMAWRIAQALLSEGCLGNGPKGIIDVASIEVLRSQNDYKIADIDHVHSLLKWKSF